MPVKTISQVDFFGDRCHPFQAIGGFVEPIELSVLEALITMVSVKSVLEIGVNRGWTAKRLLEACPQLTEYMGIEIRRNAFRDTRSWQFYERDFGDEYAGWYARADPRFSIYLSNGGSADFRSARDYDLVFIDGDHREHAVRRDTKLAKSVHPRAIVWHDYGLLGDVTRVVQNEGGAVHVLKTKVAYKILKDGSGCVRP